MTAKLCSELKYNFCNASVRNDFFDGSERAKVNRFEKLEQPSVGSPINGCKTNLYFGFFFDGTKNNYVLADKNKTHSNIARLYDCYPGLSVPGVLPKITDWEYNPSRYTHFFRTYIPGVASPFKEVNDSGQGLDLQGGAATGYLGEVRIVWALLQAINNVHPCFLKALLLTPQETASFVKIVVFHKRHLRQMMPPRGAVSSEEPSSDDHRIRPAFEKMPGRLYSAVIQHSANEKAGRRLLGSISADTLAWRATLMPGEA